MNLSLNEKQNSDLIGNHSMCLEWLKQFRGYHPSHEKFRAASVTNYYQTTNIENQNTNINGVIIPPLDFKNERIIDKTREWTVEISKDDIENFTKPTEGRHSVGPIDSSFQAGFEKKNITTFKNQTSQLSVASIDEPSDKNRAKFIKLINELQKIENEYDKHDIQLSLKGKITARNNEEELKIITDEIQFFNKLFASITSKYESSELNSFKVNLTKGKQSTESKIM